MKDYHKAQDEKLPKPFPPTASGVGCPEVNCVGEMMYVEPPQFHPELEGLRRAICGECGWRGWC